MENHASESSNTLRHNTLQYKCKVLITVQRNAVQYNATIINKNNINLNSDFLLISSRQRRCLAGKVSLGGSGQMGPWGLGGFGGLDCDIATRLVISSLGKGRGKPANQPANQPASQPANQSASRRPKIGRGAAAAGH